MMFVQSSGQPVQCDVCTTSMMFVQSGGHRAAVCVATRLLISDPGYSIIVVAKVLAVPMSGDCSGLGLFDTLISGWFWVNRVPGGPWGEVGTPLCPPDSIMLL